MAIGYVHPDIAPELASLYQQWIDENAPAEPVRARGECRRMAEAMEKAFPELEMVGISGIYSGHAWCITREGLEVDPTAHQFDKAPSYSKDPLRKEDFPRKCYMCGEPIFPDTPRNRRIYGEEYVGRHYECEEEWEQEMRDIDEQLAREREEAA